MSDDKSIEKSEQKRGGLASLDELRDFQVVPKEFTSPVFDAKMTLNYDSLQFNTACVKFFPRTEYVQLLADGKGRRIAVKACAQYDKSPQKWSIIKDGVPHSRVIKAKYLCGKLFELMNWNITYRYKILAVKQDFDLMSVIVFNLEEYTMLVPEEGTNTAGKTKSPKRKPMFRLEWKNIFGTPYGEFESTYKVNLDEHYLLTNIEDDDERAAILKQGTPITEGRVPVPAEIFTRPYYTPDELIKNGGNNG